MPIWGLRPRQPRARLWGRALCCLPVNIDPGDLRRRPILSTTTALDLTRTSGSLATMAMGTPQGALWESERRRGGGPSQQLKIAITWRSRPMQRHVSGGTGVAESVKRGRALSPWVQSTVPKVIERVGLRFAAVSLAWTVPGCLGQAPIVPMFSLMRRCPRVSRPCQINANIRRSVSSLALNGILPHAPFQIRIGLPFCPLVLLKRNLSK